MVRRSGALKADVGDGLDFEIASSGQRTYGVNTPGDGAVGTYNGAVTVYIQPDMHTIGPGGTRLDQVSDYRIGARAHIHSDSAAIIEAGYLDIVMPTRATWAHRSPNSAVRSRDVDKFGSQQANLA